MGIRSGGMIDGDGRFSLGIWQTLPEQVSITASSSVWYKLEANLIGTASDPHNNMTIRFRFLTSNNDYMDKFVLSSYTDLDHTDTDQIRPDQDGEMVTMWFTTPTAVDGSPMRLAFDAYHINGAMVDPTPALYVKSLRLTSYPAPF